MNNKLPKIHLIYNRYNKASKTRQAAVEVRVTYNYIQKYISTGIMLYPHQWKNGRIVNCDNIIQISQILDKIISNIRQALLDMMQEGNVDITQLSDRLARMEKSRISFIDYCNQRASIRKYGKQKDTQERYNRFIRLFSKWGKIKTFSDIRDSTIIAYDKYLTKQGMKPYSKWQNYHRFLNSFIIDAMEEGLIHKNPYKWVNIEKDKKSKGLERCLTLEEFRQLRKGKMKTESLERVRDLFVFQTYTCMRYSDLVRFNSSEIVLINGMHVYRCIQKKTGKPATIPLLSPALEILDKYHGSLPIISNENYNAYLKIVAQSVGIDKPITTHWARHTGATLLLNEGIDTNIVKKICGHSSIRITEQVYAKLFDETVVDAIESIKEKL